METTNETIGKYPKSFTYLPPYFDRYESDSRRLQNNIDLFIGGVTLYPDAKYLGINKKSTAFKKEVPVGEIYILNAHGTNLFKIGHTTNFKKRYNQMCAYSPLPLAIYKYGQCDNPNIFEDYLHKMFEKQFFKNEWFALGAEELAQIDAIFNEIYER